MLFLADWANLPEDIKFILVILFWLLLASIVIASRDWWKTK